MKRLLFYIIILILSLLLFSCDVEEASSEEEKAAGAQFTVTKEKWDSAFSRTGINSFTVSYSEESTVNGATSLTTGIFQFGDGASYEASSQNGTKRIHYNANASASTLRDIGISSEHYSDVISFMFDDVAGYNAFRYSSARFSYEKSIFHENGDFASYSVFFGKDNLVKKISVTKKSSGSSSTLVYEFSSYNKTEPSSAPTNDVMREFNAAKSIVKTASACNGLQEPFLEADRVALLDSAIAFISNYLSFDQIMSYTNNEETSTTIITGAVKNSYIALVGTPITYNQVTITIVNGNITYVTLESVPSLSVNSSLYSFEFIY